MTMFCWTHHWTHFLIKVFLVSAIGVVFLVVAASEPKVYNGEFDQSGENEGRTKTHPNIDGLKRIRR